MFTVKQVAVLTGVAEATLRAWERRYAVVAPARSPGGYRWYNDEQVGILREMARLVAVGVPPSIAAGRARKGLGVGMAAPGAPGKVAEGPDLLAAAASLDPATLRGVIDRALAAGPFEEVVDAWVLPQLERLGDAWQAGELTIAEEHFASAGLMRAIGSIYSAAPETTEAAVLVGLPAGARHEVGLLCFATCLRRIGVTVVYLGTDVPWAEWQRSATQRRARGAVIAVSMAADVPEGQTVVSKLTRMTPPLAVWVGGAQRQRISGGLALPHSVADAARVVQRDLVAGRT